MTVINSAAEKVGYIAGDPVFLSRCHALAVKVAANVKGEAYEQNAQQEPTTKASKRASLAGQVFRNHGDVIASIAYAVAAAPGITSGAAYTAFTDTDGAATAAAAITDSDIEFTISTLWDDLAGVNGWDSLNAV